MITHPPENGWRPIHKEVVVVADQEIAQKQVQSEIKTFVAENLPPNTRDFITLSPEEIRKFPRKLLDLAHQWLAEKGDHTSEVKLTKYFIELNNNDKTKQRFEPRVFIAEVRSLREHRICWTGVVHSAGGNGGYFEIRFDKRVALQRRSTTGSMKFRCFSSKCNLEQAHQIPFALPGIFNIGRLPK
jgi:hypothetical protein